MNRDEVIAKWNSMHPCLAALIATQGEGIGE